MVSLRSLLLVVGMALVLGGAPVAAEPPQVTGAWNGTFISATPIGRWASPSFPTGDTFQVNIVQDAGGAYTSVLTIPYFLVFDAPVPTQVVGNQIVIGNPPFASGTFSGDSLSGFAFVPDPMDPTSPLFIQWQATRTVDDTPGQVAACEDLPARFCVGSAAECTELVRFAPAVGDGYIDYLVKDETWADQHRSFVRRDLRQLVTYAAARVACETADWAYGNGGPIGIGDGSTSDGLAPSTNGAPDHSSHENGRHVDIAYYQLYAPDNLLRPVGRHFRWVLTAPPHALDVWRTALFVARLAEHPQLRFVAVDEQVGPLVDDALDGLVAMGAVDADVRGSLRLLYGAGVATIGHHDHMHVAMEELHPVVTSFRLTPRVLDVRSRGGHVTAHLRLADGYAAEDLDVSRVALLVDGDTIVRALPESAAPGAEGRNATVTVRFDRQEVADAIGDGTVDLAIVGAVDDLAFQAVDTLRVHPR